MTDRLLIPVQRGSRYPCSPTGAFPLGPDEPWLEPLNSEAALRRVVEVGDGWHPLGLRPPVAPPPPELAEKVRRLRDLAEGGGPAGQARAESEISPTEPPRRPMPTNTLLSLIKARQADPPRGEDSSRNSPPSRPSRAWLSSWWSCASTCWATAQATRWILALGRDCGERRSGAGARRGPSAAAPGRGRAGCRGSRYARSWGSSTSRRPSPSRFAPRTTREMASPGTVASHQALER